MINDCACIYDSGDGDQPTFYYQEWRKARKLHKCCECSFTVAIGDRYEAFSGKWEKGVETYHTCAACQDIRSSLCCEGFTFGQLWYDIEEQIFRETGLTVACVDKCVTVVGKEMLQQRWMEYLEVDK